MYGQSPRIIFFYLEFVGVDAIETIIASASKRTIDGDAGRFGIAFFQFKRDAITSGVLVFEQANAEKFPLQIDKILVHDGEYFN